MINAIMAGIIYDGENGGCPSWVVNDGWLMVGIVHQLFRVKHKVVY